MREFYLPAGFFVTAYGSKATARPDVLSQTVQPSLPKPTIVATGWRLDLKAAGLCQPQPCA